MKYFVLAYFAVVGILSVIAFIAYGFDKRRAQASGRRVPENTLHLLALFGGWPGGLLGQQSSGTRRRSWVFESCSGCV